MILSLPIKKVIESINNEQLKIYALGYQELTGTTADYMEVYQLDSEHKARKAITKDVIEEVKKRYNGCSYKYSSK